MLLFSKLVNIYQVSTAVPDVRRVLMSLRAARHLCFLCQCRCSPPLAASLCWPFSMSGKSWNPSQLQHSEHLGQWVEEAATFHLAWWTGKVKFRVIAWHRWGGGCRGECSVWLHALPQKNYAKCSLVVLDHWWRWLETCQKNGALEGMMKNDPFSQSKELLIKLPASFAQGWPREHWL